MAKVETYKVRVGGTSIGTSEGQTSLYTADKEGTLLGIKGALELTPVAATASLKVVCFGIKLNPSGTGVITLAATGGTETGADSYFLIYQDMCAKHTDMTPRTRIIDIKTKRILKEDDTLTLAYIADTASEWCISGSLVFSILVS